MTATVLPADEDAELATQPSRTGAGAARRGPVLGRLLMAVSLLAVTMVPAVVFSQYMAYQFRQRAQLVFDHQVDVLFDTMQSNLQITLEHLEGLAGLFAASKSVERDEFHAYVAHSQALANSPGLVALNYVERVAPDARAAFEEQVRTDRSLAPEGYPAFAIHPDLHSGEEAYVLTYLEPYSLNRAAHGFDAHADPVRRATMESARDSGMMTVMEPVDLVQFAKSVNRRGLIAVLPVYRNGAPQETVADRRAALVGFVAGAFKVRELFAGILEGMDPLIDVEVFDGPVLTEDHLLFDRDAILRIHSPDAPGAFHTIKALPVGGRLWTVCLTTRPGFGWDPVRAYLPSGILIIGLVLSVLLAGVMLSLSGSRAQAMRLAENMTKTLRENEERYRRMIDSAPDPILTLSPTGFIESVNPAAEKVSGHPRKELVGRHLTQTGVLAARSIGLALKEFTLVLAGQDRLPVEYHMVAKDGRPFVMEAHAYALRSQGRVSSVQVIMRDATARRQLADTEQQHKRELQEANKRLREMAALKDDFVAKVSHELRTPLTSIKEGLNLLIDNALGQTNPEQQDFLKTMDQDIDRLAEMINNMLDIAKIEAGALRLRRNRLDLRNAVQASQRSLQALLESRTLTVDCPDELRVFGDENRLVQVLTNLLSNAMKFTPADGRITVRGQRQNGLVTLSVQDSGIGISAEDLPKLFKKFSQVGAPDVGRPRGTGLGLAVCKELVELHDGTIEASSTPGQGSTFTVRLPAYTDEVALTKSFQDLLGPAAAAGQSVGLVAINASAAVGAAPAGGAEAALRTVAEDVRRHLHRGDTVLTVGAHWVVVLAVCAPDGPGAIVSRLRGALPAHELRYGAALHPADGDNALALFAQASTMLDAGQAARPQSSTPTQERPA